MRSVLISLDFIYTEDGTLHPTELNTNTSDDISIRTDLTNENFVSIVNDYFDHELLNSFMISNDLTKIKVIGGVDRLFKAFANYYEYEYEYIKLNYESSSAQTIPDVEDEEDTLIIRIAYDTYALIDDLYARDNYEFHKLIENEPFSSPVTFTEPELDTIVDFESSQDGIIPNYVIKARTPGYIPTNYPIGYRLDSIEELNSLKQNLGHDEFIQKFEFNNSLTLIEGRTSHLRTMSLVFGQNLDVLNLIHYKSLNSVSTQNNILVYDEEIDSNKKLNDLFLSKYYPTWWSKTGLNYHSDSTDHILKPDGSLISFVDLQINDSVKSILLTKEENNKNYKRVSIADNFTLGSSDVHAITKARDGIFINITATNDTYGTYSWYDGPGNSYVVKKLTSSGYVGEWVKGGHLNIGDEIMIFDKSLNQLVSFSIESMYYDIKNLDLYLIGLTPDPEFLVQLNDDNSDLFLIQHNACQSFCAQGPGVSCDSFDCNDCGKNSFGCINCGGSSTTSCFS